MIRRTAVLICKHMLINVFWKRITIMCVLYSGEMRKQRKKEFFSKPKTIKELIRCIQRYPFLCARYKRMTQALKEFDIQKNTGDLDCTVVGSDEIWNIKVSQFQNPIFYGGVEQKNCIAYAPSAGQAALKDYNDFPWVRECLEKMTYAGVRDENTKNIVGKLVAKQVEIVCDPTMLLPINELDFPHERKIKDRVYDCLFI